MNFDELILEAAKSIAKATSALIRAATEAQRELVTQGKVSKSTSNLTEDGQWSEGLLSAARMVAAATHNLCEAANALVAGNFFITLRFPRVQFLNALLKFDFLGCVISRRFQVFKP